MFAFLSITPRPVTKLAGSRVLRQVDVGFDLGRSLASVEICATLGEKGVATRSAIEGTPGRGRTTLWLPEPAKKSVVNAELKSAGKVVARASAAIGPCRKWKLHLLHQSHFDYGYTSIQPDILRLQLANLDTALDYIGRFEDRPDNGKFRWNVECTFPLLKYLESRPPRCRERLLKADRAGLLEVAAMPFTMQSEGCTATELMRSLYPVRVLREMGFAIRTAVQSDVPGTSALLPRILNDIGVRHLAMAPNNFRAPFHKPAANRLPRPFIWQGPHGGELMTWFTDLYDHVYQEGNILGFLDSVEAAEAQIGPRLSELEADGFPWCNLGLRTQGSYSDNGRPNLRIAEVVQAWNERYLTPEVTMSTFHQYFSALESETRGRLKKIRAFWPDWWNEGIGSMSREFGMHRRSQEKASFAQTALVLASRGNPDPGTSRLVDETWQNILLCDEHTWGAAAPLENAEAGPTAGELQAGFKKSFFFQGALLAGQAEDAGRATWAMTTPRSGDPTVVVQNALSWPRSGLVELLRSELEVLTPGAKSWKFRDRTTGSTLPCQQIVRGHVSAIQVHVGDVPAFGQRVLDVEALQADEPSIEIPLTNRDIWRGHLENGRSSLDSCPFTGGLLRWFNRETGKVVADSSDAFLLGSIIHQKFARRHEYFVRQEIESTAREEDSHIEKVEEGPLFSRLVLSTKCGAMKVRREFVLHHTVSRLDIVTTLQKPHTNDPEAVFMALPLAVPKGRCILGTNGGPMIPGRDQIPGSSSDWFVLRDHLDVAGPSGGVMVALPDTPLVQLGDIRKASIRGTGSNPHELFVYVLNNLWPTNFAPSQGGDLTFRASLMDYSHAYDAAWSRRRALECVSPLRAFGLAANAGSRLHIDEGFLQVEASDNVIASLHPSDGGAGMHVEETGGSPGHIRLRFSGADTHRVRATNVAGEVLREISLRGNSASLRLKPDEILSLKIEPAKGVNGSSARTLSRRTTISRK